MAYKIKNSIPKREDPEYKEIEDFEDFELINNAFYEMGIRRSFFKKLTKKYAYCESLSKEINKQIKWVDPFENFEFKDYTEGECSIFTIVKKTAKENFEEALKQLENNSSEKYDVELYKLLKLDFESFKKEIEILSLECKTNEELINHYSYIEGLVDLIPEIIEKEFYIDFYSFYYEEDDNIVQKDVEYEESNATSLYIKREYKKNHYIETVIDSDNNKITKTLYPLSKRKLLTDHILKFSSNHLILYKQVIKFSEDLFKDTQVKLKKQTALSDAFFCYDYYQYRLEEVAKKNKRRQEQNLENFILQDAIESIELINNDSFMTDAQKRKERISDEEVIGIENLNLLKEPTLNKTSKSYIFAEQKFKKSGINSSTALKYYQWIKPYIDGAYIKVINTEILL